MSFERSPQEKYDRVERLKQHHEMLLHAIIDEEARIADEEVRTDTTTKEGVYIDIKANILIGKLNTVKDYIAALKYNDAEKLLKQLDEEVQKVFDNLVRISNGLEPIEDDIE